MCAWIFLFFLPEELSRDGQAGRPVTFVASRRGLHTRFLPVALTENSFTAIARCQCLASVTTASAVTLILLLRSRERRFLVDVFMSWAFGLLERKVEVVLATTTWIATQNI